MALYQDLYAKFVSMMSPKCSIVENCGELMLMALHTHFLPQQQYSRMYAQFLAFHAWVYDDEDESFFHFFLQFNEHTELMVLLFFQNPFVILAHVLQHYHDFQSSVAIFPSVVQAYTQPYLFGGRTKRIICQIRHELSVTIHEIITSWKKGYMADPIQLKTLSQRKLLVSHILRNPIIKGTTTVD